MAQDKVKEDEEDEERTAMMAASIYLSDLALPGLQFDPCDNDLVEFYIPRKLRSLPLPPRLFFDFDVYSCNPRDIPSRFAAALALPKNYDKETNKKMFFFTPRHPAASSNASSSSSLSSPTTARFNRTAGNGFWHGNSDVKLIFDGDNNVVGRKTSFQYKKIRLDLNAGRSNNKRSTINTNWIMHEYCLPNHKVDDIVLSVIYEKKSTAREGESGCDDDER